MGARRFIFCVCSVAILTITTLPNALAGPYDKEIANLQKQIDDVNSDIDEINKDIQTEEQKIVDLQNELLDIDKTITETEALINNEDTQLVKHPIRLELLADDYIDVWSSRSEPFQLRRELAIDSYVRNDERMNSVLTQSAQLTDETLRGIRSQILYKALIDETEGRLQSVDSKMRITGERVSEVHEEITVARSKQKDYVQLQEEARLRIPEANERISNLRSGINTLESNIETLKIEINRLDGEIERYRLLELSKQWTGLPGTDIRRPALAVKIDNVSIARPQAGINQADIVYEELVEAGLTRLIAIFQTTDSRVVGPVRSARTSDPPLLAGFDNPLFAYSGANRGTREVVKDSDLTDVGYDTTRESYWRSTSRRAPHNLFTSTERLWSQYPNRDEIPKPPFTFRTENSPLHANAKKATGVFVDFGHAEIDYSWNGTGWERTHNGEPHGDGDGVRVAPTNIVIQFISYGKSVADSRSPEAITKGSGEVWVFTDGHLIEGEWERKKDSEPAEITSDGTPIRLTPGNTWIALTKTGTATWR
jgi:predicted  nucleic acid-binding Zn-ribbon protein